MFFHELDRSLCKLKMPEVVNDSINIINVYYFICHATVAFASIKDPTQCDPNISFLFDLPGWQGFSRENNENFSLVDNLANWILETH